MATIPVITQPALPRTTSEAPVITHPSLPAVHQVVTTSPGMPALLAELELRLAASEVETARLRKKVSQLRRSVRPRR